MNNIVFTCLQTRIEKNTNEFYASFQLGFFAPNQGLTIAHALRRTILTSTCRCGISGVFIENVKHEYCCITGIKETVFDILLNLKKIIFVCSQQIVKTQKIYLNCYGPQTLKAKHLHLPAYIHCLNPESYITTLENDGCLKMTIFLDQPIGQLFCYCNDQYSNLIQYRPNSREQKNGTNFYRNSQFLTLDTTYSPIRKLNYKVKKSRRSREIIFFEIWTNGSIHPKYIIKKAIHNILTSLIPFHSSKKVYLTPRKSLFLRRKNDILKNKKFFNKLFKLDLSNFALSEDLLKLLYTHNIYTLLDLHHLLIPNNHSLQFLSSDQKKEIRTFLRIMDMKFNL